MSKSNKPKQNEPYKYRYYSNARNITTGPTGTNTSGGSGDDNRKISFIVVIGSLIFLLSVFLFTNRTNDHPIKALTKSIADITSAVRPYHHTQVTETYADMSKAVNGVINSNSDIDFEVSVENLNNASQLNFGQTGPMIAGSVSKVMTATDFLSQVEQGNESLGEILEDGNTASYDLQQMIVVSDDTSWESLNDELSYSQLQTYANGLGLTTYNWLENTLSAQDTVTLFTQLYQGKLLDQANTQLLLGYMEQANYRNMIVAVVPSSDTVYHKVGEYNDNVNDAAIVTNGKQTIVLAIYTNGNGIYDWSGRATMIQDIAKPILEYYGLN